MIDGAGAGRYRGVRAPPPSAFRGRGWSHFLSGVFLKRLISMMDLLHCHKRCLENRSDVLCYHQPTCGNSRNLRVCLFVYGRGGRGPTAGRKLEILNYIWCPNITRCHVTAVSLLLVLVVRNACVMIPLKQIFVQRIKNSMKVLVTAVRYNTQM